MNCDMSSSPFEGASAMISKIFGEAENDNDADGNLEVCE